MNKRFGAHLLWGSHSPLSALTGSSLIILASSRFSFALVSAAALIWVYGFTALIFTSARRIMPSRGKMVILLFLTTFLCASFMLFMGLLNPLLLLGTIFFLLLVPPCCLSSGFFESIESVEPIEASSRALLEAVTLSCIILASALIREPLGMGTFSIPGGHQGIVELSIVSNPDNFVPLRILSISAGGFLFLGYVTALYRYIREQSGGIPRDITEDRQ